jgi:hypothetical protein
MPRAPRTETPNSEEKMEEEKVSANQPYFVKKTTDGKYAVVSKTGETVRVYEEEEGCEDPKKSAKMYAEKLSTTKL